MSALSINLPFILIILLMSIVLINTKYAGTLVYFADYDQSKNHTAIISHMLRFYNILSCWDINEYEYLFYEFDLVL